MNAPVFLPSRSIGSSGRRSSAFLYLSVFLAAAFLLAFAAPALADSVPVPNPGDQYVFGADSPVTDTHTAIQISPRISGSIVVWSDSRPGGGVQNPSRIFYKDLSKADPETPLVQSPGGGLASDSQDDPVISGNLVVWLQGPGGGSYSPSQIHYMFLGSGCPGAAGCDQVLNLPGAAPVSLAVSGHRIVWQGGSTWQGDIYMYDLDNPSLGAQPEVTTPGDDVYPAIDGDWLVWIHNDDYWLGSPVINDVFAKNLATGEVRQLTSDGNNVLQDRPAISGSKIAWVVNGSSGSDNLAPQVFVYDLLTGQTKAIPGSDHVMHDSISGNIVVWATYDANGQWNNYQVFMNNLATGITQQVSASNTNVFDPDVSASSGYVVWQDRRLGPDAIFKNRIGDTAKTLADRYKPELKMAQNENFEPMPVEPFLAQQVTYPVFGTNIVEKTALEQRNNSSFSIPNPTVATLAQYSATSDLFVDLPGSSIEAGGGDPSISIDHALVNQYYVQPYLAIKSQFPATIYARVVSRPADNTNSFIQYWLFYYANDYPELFHEGDWEVVQVDLDGNLQPYRADYSHHGGGQWRNWNGPGSVEKSSGDPNRPVVYVAQGSHANYFHDGEYSNFFYSWDVAHGNGDILNDPNNSDASKQTSATVVPEVKQSDGTPFQWLKFTGQWGEYTGANVGYGVFVTGGLRDGPDNPPVQQPWNNAFAWDGETCDGCQDQSAQGTDTEITILSPVDINLYDSQGHHTGKNPDGSIDEQIPNSEYLEYPELHRKSIIIHGGDITPGYRLEATGTGTGTANMIISAPDHAAGKVDTLNYNNIQVNPSTRIAMNLDSSQNYSAAIDVYGDGTDLIQKAPDTTTTNTVDFTPPAQINNLAITSTTSGTATLSFTAPGDDGNVGTATSYDLRYSTSAITDQYWNDAIPAGNLPTPLTAGSTQTITVSGLNAGTTYYFAIKAMDRAGQFSPISNTPTTTTTIPSLTWGIKRIYWASWADYTNRQLSIDYNLGNSGTGIAKSPTIAASIASPASVYVTTTLPLTVADLNPSASAIVTLKYYVPTTVSRFTTTTYASCQDDAGRTYWFPGPMP